MTFINERVIVARINRRLSKAGERLHMCAEKSKWFNDLGRFYATNNSNVICATHIDVEQWAKELGTSGNLPLPRSACCN